MGRFRYTLCADPKGKEDSQSQHSSQNLHVTENNDSMFMLHEAYHLTNNKYNDKRYDCNIYLHVFGIVFSQLVQPINCEKKASSKYDCFFLLIHFFFFLNG